MRRSYVCILLAAVLLAGGPGKLIAQESHHGHHEEAESDDGLIENLGDHAYDITTDSDRAQAFFNQGLRLYYAFNHAESVNSFKEAQRLDPDCAMCYWGEALAWGPNINVPMDDAGHAAAVAAVAMAVDRLDQTTEKERALIEALSKRYSSNPEADRGDLDRAYADAMPSKNTTPKRR